MECLTAEEKIVRQEEQIRVSGYVMMNCTHAALFTKWCYEG